MNKYILYYLGNEYLEEKHGEYWKVFPVALASSELRYLPGKLIRAHEVEALTVIDAKLLATTRPGETFMCAVATALEVAQ